MKPIAALLALPIRLYRLCLAPFLAPACRFHPSCSAYALEALERHGPWRGSLLALARLARCHPIRWLGGGEGFDPVPPAHTSVPE
jgi:putative membrane protein insertion efficiency factor